MRMPPMPIPEMRHPEMRPSEVRPSSRAEQQPSSGRDGDRDPLDPPVSRVSRKAVWLMLSLTLGSLALAQPARRPNPGVPAPVMPWNIPPDLVAVPRPVVERMEVGGLQVRARIEPQHKVFEATLLVRTAGMSAASRLALTHTLRYGGAEGLEGAKFGEMLARMGAELEVSAQADQLELTVRGGIEPVVIGEGQSSHPLLLLGQLVKAPANSDVLLGRTRESMQHLLSTRRSDPLTVGLDQLRSMVFQEHPYATQLRPGEIEALELDGLKALHSEVFSPSRSILTVTSPLDASLVKGLVEQAFAGWEGAVGLERLSLPKPLDAAAVQTLPSPSAKMVVVAGRMVVPANPLERAASRVLASALEASLQRSIPDRERLRAGARLEEHGDAAFLWTWVEGASPASTDAILRQELARAGQGGLVPREIEYARARALSEVLRPLTSTEGFIRANARLELLRGVQPAEGGVSAEIEMLRALPPSAVADMGRALLGRGALAIVMVVPEGTVVGSAPFSLPRVVAPASAVAPTEGAPANAAGAGVNPESGAAAGAAATAATAAAGGAAGAAIVAATEPPQVKKSKGKRAKRLARKGSRRARRR